VPWSRPNRSGAMSAKHPGELIHLDIKKLGRIGSVGHRITGRRVAGEAFVVSALVRSISDWIDPCFTRVFPDRAMALG
jgi:hypothetical protein